MFCRIIIGLVAAWLALFPSFALAQSVISSFPPGTFQNRAALSGTPSGGSPLVTPVLFSGASSGPSTSAASYSAIVGPGAVTWSTVADRQQVPVAVPGTIGNLRFNGVAGSGSGVWSVTLRKNGASTALNCTTATAATPATCNDTTDTVSVVAGDLLDWQMCPGTLGLSPTFTCSPGTAPTALTTGIQISATFTGTNNGEGPISVGWSGSNPSNAAITYASLGTVANTTEVNASSIISTSGTLDHLYVGWSVNVTVGTWTFTVWKNGAATSLACKITGSVNNCNSVAQSTDTPVTVVATDLISVEMCPGTTSGGTCTVSGTPTFGGYGMGLRWQPTTTGEVMAFANNVSNCPPSGSSFWAIGGGCTSSENVNQNISPVAMHYTNMQILVGTAVGAGATRVATLRANGATATGGATCTISATGTTCSNTGNYSSSAGDLMDIGQTVTGSPGTNPYSKASMTMRVP